MRDIFQFCLQRRDLPFPLLPGLDTSWKLLFFVYLGRVEKLTCDEMRHVYRQLALKGPETHLHFPLWVPETMLQGQPTVYACPALEIPFAVVSTWGPSIAEVSFPPQQRYLEQVSSVVETWLQFFAREAEEREIR